MSILLANFELVDRICHQIGREDTREIYILLFVELELISYFCTVGQEMPKEEYVRRVFKTSEYESFYIDLNDKIKSKFDYAINIITTIYNVPIKFIKRLENTDLYEMRVSV